MHRHPRYVIGVGLGIIGLFVSLGVVRQVPLYATQKAGQVTTSGAPSNIVRGLPSWMAVLLAPDPAWGTGSTDGPQDAFCQADHARINNGNQTAWTCFGVPDPVSGYWNSVVRLKPYTGHVSHQYPNAGYEIGVEGTYLNGVESVDRLYIWDFLQQRTIAKIDLSGNFVEIGQTDKPIDLLVTGNITAKSFITN